MTVESARIAVVGAGLAGAAAARDLAAAGADVVLFDKARGPGGRTSTRRADAWAFDHGAQYFTARGEGFRRLVRAWVDAGIAAPWRAKLASLEAGTATPADADGPRYVGVPRMSALGRALAGDVPIETQCRIRAIERSGARWRLHAEDRALARPEFDAVVCAVPAAQAVPLLAEAPALALRAKDAELAPCQAAMVAFRTAVPAEFDAARVSASPLAWIANNGSKPERPPGHCWVLHGSPEWSRAHVDRPPDEVAQALLAAFAEALGRPLPDVEYLAAHRWLYALPTRTLGVPHLLDAEAGIGACGDWLEGNRIEAAVESGRSLAAALTARLG